MPLTFTSECDREEFFFIKGVLCCTFATIGLVAAYKNAQQEQLQNAQKKALHKNLEAEITVYDLPCVYTTSPATGIRHIITFSLALTAAILATACGNHELTAALQKSDGPEWTKSDAFSYTNDFLTACAAALLSVLAMRMVSGAANLMQKGVYICYKRGADYMEASRANREEKRRLLAAKEPSLDDIENAKVNTAPILDIKPKKKCCTIM
jgi:hypothetical protein